MLHGIIIYEFSSSEIVYVNVTRHYYIYILHYIFEFSSSQIVYVNVTWHNYTLILKFTNCLCKCYMAQLYTNSQVYKLFM
jgi:hypothetical protein